MPANIDPIYSLAGVVQGTKIGLAANTRNDGSGTIATDIFNCFTAGPNGSYVSRVRLHPNGSVPATATTATVHRIYTSNKITGGTLQDNTWLFQEVAAPAQTADQTTTATNYIEVPLNFALPISGTILVSSHHINAAGTMWTATVFGGNY